MPEPLFVFAFVIASLIGAVFHLIFGGNARRLALFMMASWAGFAMGQVAGRSFEIELFAIGNLRLFSAVIGSLFFLIMALIFTSNQRRTR